MTDTTWDPSKPILEIENLSIKLASYVGRSRKRSLQRLKNPMDER